MELLITPVTVWTGHEVVERAAIRIRGETIASIDRADDVSPPTDESTYCIPGEGKLAIPGLINAHTHLYSSLARGMAVTPFHPTSFTQILEQLWWKLDKALDADAIRSSALIGAMEAARCGVTTLIDHHASPNAVAGSLDLLREQVCDRVGLRGVFSYELSDRDGPTRVDEGIEETMRFLDAAPSAGSRWAAQVGLHASFTLSDGTLERIAERLPDDTGVHVHVAEGIEDEELCIRRHGQRVVHRLDRYGLVRPASILVHALHVDEEEKDLIAERGAAVVHNPRSNMNNAVGSFDMSGFLERGIRTGLGTDGLGDNMLGELFTAGLLQRHATASALAGSFDALDQLLFCGNPDIAARLLGAELGVLTPGGPADVVLVDYLPPTPLRTDTLLGHLLFGIAVRSLRVADVIVAGQPVLREGTFVHLDEPAAYASARGEAERLWHRIAQGGIP